MGDKPLFEGSFLSWKRIQPSNLRCGALRCPSNILESLAAGKRSKTTCIDLAIFNSHPLVLHKTYTRTVHSCLSQERTDREKPINHIVLARASNPPDHSHRVVYTFPATETPTDTSVFKPTPSSIRDHPIRPPPLPLQLTPQQHCCAPSPADSPFPADSPASSACSPPWY